MEEMFNSQVFEVSQAEPHHTAITVFPLGEINNSMFHTIFGRIVSNFPKKFQQMSYEFHFLVQQMTIRQLYELSVLQKLFEPRAIEIPGMFSRIPILSVSMTLQNAHLYIKQQSVAKHGSFLDLLSSSKAVNSVRPERIFQFPPPNDISGYTAEDAFLLYLLNINLPDFIIAVYVVRNKDFTLSTSEAYSNLNLLVNDSPFVVGAQDLTKNVLIYMVNEEGEEFDVNCFEKEFLQDCSRKMIYFQLQEVSTVVCEEEYVQVNSIYKEMMANETILRIIEGKQVYAEELFDETTVLIGRDCYEPINRFSRLDGLWKVSLNGQYVFSGDNAQLISRVSRERVPTSENVVVKVNFAQHRKLIEYALSMLRTGFARIAEKLLSYADKICPVEEERTMIQYLLLHCEERENKIDREFTKLLLQTLGQTVLELIKAGYPLFAMRYQLYFLHLGRAIGIKNQDIFSINKSFECAASFVHSGVTHVELMAEFCSLEPQAKISKYYMLRCIEAVLSHEEIFELEYRAFHEHLAAKRITSLQFSRAVFESLTYEELTLFRQLGCLSFYASTKSIERGFYMPLISSQNDTTEKIVRFVNPAMSEFRLFSGMAIHCGVTQEHLEELSGISCTSEFTFFKREFSEMFISDVEDSDLECLLSGQRTMVTISLPALYMTQDDLLELEVDVVRFENGNFQIASIKHDIKSFSIIVTGIYMSESLEDHIEEVQFVFNNIVIRMPIRGCSFYSRFKYANLQLSQVKCMSMNYFCNLYKVKDFPTTYQEAHNFVVLELKFNREMINFISMQNFELGYFRNEFGEYEEIRYNTNIQESCLLLFSQADIQSNSLNFSYGFDKLGKVDVKVANLSQQLEYITMPKLCHIHQGDMAYYIGSQEIINAGKRVVMRRAKNVTKHAVFRPTGEYLDSSWADDLENNYWIDEMSELEFESSITNGDNDKGQLEVRIPEILGGGQFEIACICHNCQVIEENEQFIKAELHGTPYQLKMSIQTDEMQIGKQVVIEGQ